MQGFLVGVVWKLLASAWSSITTAVKISYWKSKAAFKKKKEDFQTIRDEKIAISHEAEAKIEEASNDVVAAGPPPVSSMAEYVPDYGDDE